MALSGSYDATTTATEIIKEALSLINVHDDDEAIPPEMWTYCLSQLNKVMKFMSIHRGLWMIEDVEVTLTPGTASYTIGTSATIDNVKPIRITHARRSESVDIPIDVVGRQEYMDIPNKTLQAPATMLYYQPGRTTGTIYVWPTGTTSDNTLYITTHRPMQDFDAAGNNPDFPMEWALLAEHMLAMFIAPKYLGGVVPPGVKENGELLLASLMSFDEEESDISFQP